MSLQANLELDGTDGAAVTANTTDGGNSGFGNKTGTWLFETTGKASGTAFARTVLTGGTAAFTLFHTAARTIAGYDSIQRFSAVDGGGKIIGRIRLGSTNLAQVFIKSTGEIQLRDGILARATTIATLSDGDWFRWAWFISGNQMSAKIWISGTLVDLFSTPTEVLDPVTYSGGPWDQVSVGAMSAWTCTFDQDRFMWDTSQFPSTGGSANDPPIADAGPDQSVTSGATVTLDGTGSSDPDGSIISRLWHQTGGPAVTLSSTTIASPTFPAPTVGVETDLTFQFSVIDNDGAQSTPDTVIITVEPGTGTPTDDYYELHEGMSTGDTVTTSNTSYDSVDAGITATGTGIGEGVHSISGTSAAIQSTTRILTGGAVSDGYIDGAHMIAALPASGQFTPFCQVRSGSSGRASLRINSDGTIGVIGKNGSATTEAARTTHAITPGVPFRYAWRPHNGAHQVLHLFLGAGLESQSVPIENLDSGFDLTTGTWDRVRRGLPLAPGSSATWTSDTNRINLTGFPDPLTTASADDSNLWEMGADGIIAETQVSFIV